MKRNYIAFAILAIVLSACQPQSVPVSKPEYKPQPAEVRIDTVKIINYILPDSVEIEVDLNDYLGFVDEGTDWNYTELDSYTAGILQQEKVYESKGIWVKKFKVIK